MATLVAGPKVFQALCRDNIFPYISFFGKGYGTGDDPRRAGVLCLIVAAALLLIGIYLLIFKEIFNFRLIFFST